MNTERKLPKPGEYWRHFKKDSHIYEIICLAKSESTLEDLIVYKDLDNPGKIWVRSLSVFMDTLPDGTTRFRKV